ncbi:MAG: hypothetical protein WC942_10790 [Clostridia bacterium]|jgi:hypothetical protein
MNNYDLKTGRFIKGSIPWNKGVTKETDKLMKQISNTLKKRNPQLHSFETRLCVCGCGKSFTCNIVSNTKANKIELTSLNNTATTL